MVVPFVPGQPPILPRMPRDTRGPVTAVPRMPRDTYGPVTAVPRMTSDPRGASPTVPLMPHDPADPYGTAPMGPTEPRGTLAGVLENPLFMAGAGLLARPRVAYAAYGQAPDQSTINAMNPMSALLGGLEAARYNRQARIDSDIKAGTLANQRRQADLTAAKQAAELAEIEREQAYIASLSPEMRRLYLADPSKAAEIMARGMREPQTPLSRDEKEALGLDVDDVWVYDENGDLKLLDEQDNWRNPEYREFKKETARAGASTVQVPRSPQPGHRYIYDAEGRVVGQERIPGAKIDTDERQRAGHTKDMFDSQKELERFEAAGIDSGGLIAQYAQNGWSLANLALSPAERQYLIHARRWAEARLRAQTGAAATEGEVRNVLLTYFAAVGDDPETVSEKSRARREVQGGQRQIIGPVFNELFGDSFGEVTLPDLGALDAATVGKLSFEQIREIERRIDAGELRVTDDMLDALADRYNQILTRYGKR